MDARKQPKVVQGEVLKNFCTDGVAKHCDELNRDVGSGSETSQAMSKLNNCMLLCMILSVLATASVVFVVKHFIQES